MPPAPACCLDIEMVGEGSLIKPRLPVYWLAEKLRHRDIADKIIGGSLLQFHRRGGSRRAPGRLLCAGLCLGMNSVIDGHRPVLCKDENADHRRRRGKTSAAASNWNRHRTAERRDHGRHGGRQIPHPKRNWPQKNSKTAKEQPAEDFNHPDGIGRFHGRRNSWTKWTSQRHGAGTGKRKTFLPADGGILLRQGYGGQGFTQMRQTVLNRRPYRKPNQPRNTPNTRTPHASGGRSGFFAYFASFAVQRIYVTVQVGSGRDASARRPGVAVLPWTPRRGVPT